MSINWKLLHVCQYKLKHKTWHTIKVVVDRVVHTHAVVMLVWQDRLLFTIHVIMYVTEVYKTPGEGDKGLAIVMHTPQHQPRVPKPCIIVIMSAPDHNNDLFYLGD
jgi:hypothetical protein